jgi:hypothetical protein
MSPDDQGKNKHKNQSYGDMELPETNSMYS